jgi:hypothetical protein
MQILRIVATTLAAFSMLAVSTLSFPAASAAKTLHCETAKDCPKGDICKIKPHHKTGICVAPHPAKMQTRKLVQANNVNLLDQMAAGP